MKKLALTISVAALALAGAAYAMPEGPMNDPMGASTITRAEAEAKARAMFDKLDINHDGKLDRADREAHQADQFKKMDTDGNGVISSAEFAAAHDRGPGKDGAEPRREGGKHPMMAMMLLHKADTNHDNAVSRDEFVAAALDHFDKTDTNHDGKVTPQERRAAMKAMRGHMKGMRGMEHGDDHSDGPMPSAH